MELIILFIGIGIGGVVILFAVGWRASRREGTSVVEEVVGICQAALERSSQKEIRKQRALTLLQQTRSTSSGQEGLGNAEIRQALGVSRQSVVRYMTELEKEGRVAQMGDVGRGVLYRSI